MSLTKKDPSLRVAANDPHLVSLGGGRLSTAVTIHYIPIGDTTIGSSTSCSISLNGTGVRSTHCTIYRSEENEVTIVPEHDDARILIDGTKITQETNLTQGAMITIGNSNYLRFNNPAEAQMMRSAMGSNERISMPQIDFTQVPPQPQRNSTKSNGSSNGTGSDVLRQSLEIESFYETKINPITSTQMSKEASVIKGYNNPIDLNGLQCPKVFTADLVTVNMPAKDVLGQKYANFAKNFAENHRNDKNVNNALRNNQVNNLKTNAAQNIGAGNYVNIPSTSNYIQNTNSTESQLNFGSTEYLTKVNNTTSSMRITNATNHFNHHHHNVTPAYDRYPKPGSYGGLQIFPMNGVNTDINNGSPQQHHHQAQKSFEASPSQSGRSPQILDQKRNGSNIRSSTENERLEDMLKICTEYADRQNQSSNSSITSSPIVQNRIKTNGSLPRDKKSPFYHELSGTQLQQSFTGSSNNLASKPQNGSFANTSSGYENVRLVGRDNRVEIGNNSIASSPKPSTTGYENVVVGKYVPQSPRTKIRTTCMSPKKENSFSSATFGQTSVQQPPLPNPKPSKQSEYEQLIKTFEEKLKLEMKAIEESSRYQPNTSNTTTDYLSSKRANKNINNLTLNLKQSNSLQNSPKLSKKPAPAPRALSKTSLTSSTNSLPRLVPTQRGDAVVNILEHQDKVDIEQLKRARKDLLAHIQSLKRDITELRKQEDEALRELDMEKALVSAELSSMGDSVGEFESKLQSLQNKIHRLEAQRNATRVMEENQQAKLKQSIEMKQDQVKQLKAMLKQKPNNDCLKEELHNVCDSLENDRKTFEDLEFQYLEEESEWHAYREELHAEEQGLVLSVDEKRLELQCLAKQELTNQSNATSDAKTIKHNLISLLNELKHSQDQLKALDNSMSDITGLLHTNSSDDDDESLDDKHSASSAALSPPSLVPLGGVMSQSLFGSAELLCPKRNNDDIMSKSVNENMFYNNKIELPSTHATSTPKRPQLQLVNIADEELLDVKLPTKQSETLLRAAGVGAESRLSQSERVKFNLSLGSDDFEVNPLERRAPSQDDIDRISKVTLDAPISTKGASTKIFDSIKEIERNRQLLLAQQGHHVIEHERQKMQDLKKKCHDEARAQYLSMLSVSVDSASSQTAAITPPPVQQKKAQEMQILGEESERLTTTTTTKPDKEQKNAGGNGNSASSPKNTKITEENSSQQRYSQPEFDSSQQQQHLRDPRPLSEGNSDLSCELLSDATCKSSTSIEHTTATPGIGCTGIRYSTAEQNINGDDAANKRSSVNSNETASGGSGGSGSAHNERKRVLPKHQRPLTRYLPIFSPDLNLRQHIESAGHQIALCPHVFVDAHSCRGYLHKLGATFHGWARRWFVLDRQRNAFIYYADKSERKPRGGAYFSTIDEVYLDHLNTSKSGRPHCTFIVKTKKRSYHLQAASDAAARIWIDAIITGAQGNLDY